MQKKYIIPVVVQKAIIGLLTIFAIVQLSQAQLEHPSILNTLKYYAQEYCLNYKLIGVDNKGIIKKDELEKALSEGAGLCTIIGVNNELGIIQNINAIYDLCHKYNCKLHTDLTQAFSHIDISKLKYDYASLSAHKFGGLQGVGTLLCNSPTILLLLEDISKALCVVAHIIFPESSQWAKLQNSTTTLLKKTSVVEKSRINSIMLSHK